MKTKLISARIPQEDAAIIDEVALEERTDRTTALKKILLLGAKRYKLERAVRCYQKGAASIGRAAEIAGMSIWEMQDELASRGIPNLL